MIASEPATAQNVGRQLGTFLRETEPSQRQAIVNQLRRESGLEVEKVDDAPRPSANAQQQEFLAVTVLKAAEALKK